jgi:hypothetical protein
VYHVHYTTSILRAIGRLCLCLSRFRLFPCAASELDSFDSNSHVTKKALSLKWTNSTQACTRRQASQLDSFKLTRGEKFLNWTRSTQTFTPRKVLRLSWTHTTETSTQRKASELDSTHSTQTSVRRRLEACLNHS